MSKQRKYQVIYADPPWPERGGGRIKRGADRHYELMSVEAIKGLPIGELTEENCHLYLWVTNNYLADGLEVMKAWGFRYVTKITWIKENHIGLGQYFRGKTEDCLFGVRGNLPYKTTEDGKRAQGATAIFASRTKHSEKPDEMREIIELVSHEPRIELFARRERIGWDVWGNEVESDIELANMKGDR